MPTTKKTSTARTPKFKYVITLPCGDAFASETPPRFDENDTAVWLSNKPNVWTKFLGHTKGKVQKLNVEVLPEHLGMIFHYEAFMNVYSTTPEALNPITSELKY